MKQLKVSEKCSGCGLCIPNCKYLKESEDGNAVPVSGMAISASDMDRMSRLVKNCPEHALSIIEVSSTTKSGKEGLKELKNQLERKAAGLTIGSVNKSDISFNAKEYDISVPYSSKQYRYVYSSESQAKSAARDEFERLCYSPSAYRPILKKIFVEYKFKKLKPYYGISGSEDSVYRRKNLEIETFLRNIYAEAKEINGGTISLPESWCEFHTYLSAKDWQIESLMNFEEKSTNSGIISELKSQGKYTSLSWYVDRMDYDYEEMYDGEGLFGRSKYKNKWNFTGFEAAAKEFIDDLKSAMDDVSSDIEEYAIQFVNSAVGEYEKKAKQALAEKARTFAQSLKL